MQESPIHAVLRFQHVLRIEANAGMTIHRVDLSIQAKKFKEFFNYKKN